MSVEIAKTDGVRSETTLTAYHLETTWSLLELVWSSAQ